MEITDKNKVIGLGVLIVLWTALIFFRVYYGEEQQRVPLKYVKGKARVSRMEATRGAKSDAVINFALLEKKGSIPLLEKRNIFAPIPSPLKPAPPKPKPAPPPLPPEPPAPPPEPVVVAPPPPPLPPPGPSPEELAAEQSRMEIARFKYLGFLLKRGEKVLFVARDKELFIVREGETFVTDYYLKEATRDYVIIEDRTTGISGRLEPLGRK